MGSAGPRSALPDAHVPLPSGTNATSRAPRAPLKEKRSSKEGVGLPKLGRCLRGTMRTGPPRVGGRSAELGVPPEGFSLGRRMVGMRPGPYWGMVQTLQEARAPVAAREQAAFNRPVPPCRARWTMAGSVPVLSGGFLYGTGRRCMSSGSTWSPGERAGGRASSSSRRVAPRRSSRFSWRSRSTSRKKLHAEHRQAHVRSPGPLPHGRCKDAKRWKSALSWGIHLHVPIPEPCASVPVVKFGGHGPLCHLPQPEETPPPLGEARRQGKTPGRPRRRRLRFRGAPSPAGVACPTPAQGVVSACAHTGSSPVPPRAGSWRGAHGASLRLLRGERDDAWRSALWARPPFIRLPRRSPQGLR